MFRRTRVSAAAALAVSGLALATAVQAQQQLERVEITGSSLRRVDAESALPVTIIQVEDLVKQGVTNAEQALSRIASNQSNYGASSAVGGTTGGKAEADIRGLSGPAGTNSNKTLVLLNGRRLANHPLDAAAVDLNAIPLAAIQRIEVLRDGASAIYGTDAIGGVINFILRRDYQGIEAAVETTQPRGKGGGDTNRASIVAGFGSLADNRFNIMGTLDFRKQSALLAADRKFSETGVFRGAVNAGTSGTSFPGDLDGFEPSLPGCNPPSSIPNPTGTGCRYDFARDIDIIPENEQITGLVRGSFAITPDHTASVEVLHGRNEGVQRVAAAPSGHFMAANSPFYPVGAPVRSIPDANDPGNPNETTDCGFDNCVQGGLANWRTVPGGKRTSGFETINERAMAEVQGALAGWDYRAALGNARSKVTTTVIRGYLRDPLVQLGVFNGIINPFGDQTPEGQAALDAATGRGVTSTGKNDVKFADFRVTRDLLQLPAGPLAGSFGFEHRNEKSAFENTALTGELGSLGLDPEADTSGKRDVTALFAELGIPILKTLDITLAARYDKYSDFGNTFNPKIGVRWQPMKELLFRGSFNKGFRAPTLYDIYEPPSLTNTSNNWDDPLLCPDTDGDGVGEAVPGALPGVVCAQQVNERTAGPVPLGDPANSLQPEKSKALTLGVVFEPTPAVTVAFDFWNLKISNLIAPLPEQAVFGDPVANASRFVRCSQLTPAERVLIPNNLCFNQGFDPIAYINTPNANLGEMKTNGLDFSVTWRSGALPFGSLGVVFDATYINKYEYQRERGGEFVNAVGKYSDNAPVFRWQHSLAVSWNNAAWGATVAQRYKSKYLDETPNRTVSSYAVWDASVSFTGIKNLTLTAGILNLFDTDPPDSNQVLAFQRGYDPRFSDPLGRSLLFRAGYKFF